MLFKRDKHSKLKLILSKTFPKHKITIKDNKDGSQTITLLWLIRALCITLYTNYIKKVL